MEQKKVFGLGLPQGNVQRNDLILEWRGKNKAM